MLAWKIAPALAAGEHGGAQAGRVHAADRAAASPRSADEAGLPAGRGQHRHRRRARPAPRWWIIPAWTRSPSPAPPRSGGSSASATAGSGKKLSLELGGKSPFIVFDDADLDSVVEGVVDAIWFNQGQVCCAGSRLLAQEGIAERWCEKLQARMETLRVGDSARQGGRYRRDRRAGAAGADRRAGGTGRRRRARRCWQPRWSCPTDGLFYPPTLFTDVSPSATIAQVEIFGPVVVLMTFRTPAEAVELANNTRYGLAASVWSENINLALDVAPQLKAGTVWINCTNVFDAASGFGGYRESGFGREGGRGRDVGVPEVPEACGARRAKADSAEQAPQAAAQHGPSGVALPVRRPHPQALHRRQAGAARLRLLASPSSTAKGEPRRPRSAMATARTSATPWRRRTRRSRAGPRHGAPPRAGALLPRRKPRGARARSSRRGSRR